MSTPATARPEIDGVPGRQAQAWSVVALGLGIAMVGASLARTSLGSIMSAKFLNDVAQHGFWMWRFVDPDAFRDDPIYDFFTSDVAVMPGYWALYRVVVPLFGHPVLALEAVAVVLAIWSTAMAALIGLRVGGRWSRFGVAGAWLALAVVQYGDAQMMPSAGLQRAFAFPIALTAIWAMLGQRVLVLGGCYVLLALLYPIMLPVLGLSGVAVESIRLARTRRLPRWWWLAVLLGVASLAILSLRDVPAVYEPRADYDTARAMVEFGPMGRNVLFTDWFTYLFVSKRTGLSVPLPILLSLLVVTLVMMVAGRIRRVPMPAWVVLAVSLALYVAAHLTLFALYLPSRHLRYTLPAFFVVAWAALLPSVLERLLAWRPVGGWIVRLAKPLPVILLAVVIGGYALYRGAKGFYWDVLPAMSRTMRNASALAYLSELPPGSRFAAMPDWPTGEWTVDTARPTTMSLEHALTYHLGYYETIAKPRLEALMSAFHARDWSEIDALAEFDTTVLVLQPGWLERDLKYEPWRSRWREQRDRPGEAVLLDIPEDRVVARRGRTVFVEVRPPATEPGIERPDEPVSTVSPE